MMTTTLLLWIGVWLLLNALIFVLMIPEDDQ
jgi:hypothetical protein